MRCVILSDPPFFSPGRPECQREAAPAGYICPVAGNPHSRNNKPKIITVARIPAVNAVISGLSIRSSPFVTAKKVSGQACGHQHKNIRYTRRMEAIFSSGQKLPQNFSASSPTSLSRSSYRHGDARLSRRHPLRRFHNFGRILLHACAAGVKPQKIAVI